MRQGVLITGLFLAGSALAPAASAQTPPAPRCAILGQMAVSSWVEVLTGLNTSPEASTLDPVVARLSDLSQLYNSVGCDRSALQTALDCIVTGSGSEGPGQLARNCMGESGLTLP